MSYRYLKVGTTHFYRLALYNLVLGLTDIWLKSKLFKWWMLDGDMTDYGHATIIGVLLGKLIRVFLGIYYLTRYCAYKSNVLILCELLILTCHFLCINIYKARFFCHFFSGFICLLKLCWIWFSQTLSLHSLDLE